MSLAPAPVRAASGVTYLVAAVVVLLVEVGLYVFMTLNGRGSDFTGLGLLLTPIVLGLFAKAAVDVAAEPQNRTLATIQHQTNGVLAAKIRDGVREVLNERDAAVAAVQASQYAPGTAPALPPVDPTADPAAFTTEPAPDYDTLPDTVPQVQPFTD